MHVPNLILVPPTPSRDNPSPQPSIVPTTTASTPELTHSPIDKTRASSESAIFTIYSMYGQEEDEQSSWPAPETLPGHRHKPSKEIDLVTVARISDYQRNSYVSTNGYGHGKAVVEVQAEESTPYFDATHQSQKRSSSKRFSVADKLMSMRSSVMSDDSSVQLAYTNDSRPTSSYARTSTMTRATTDYGSPEPHSQRKSTLPPHEYALSSRSSHSRPNSRPASQMDHIDSHGGRRSTVNFPDNQPLSRSAPTSRPSSRPTSQHRKSTSSHLLNGQVDGNSTSASSSPSSTSHQLPPTPVPASALPPRLSSVSPTNSRSSSSPQPEPRPSSSNQLPVPSTPPQPHRTAKLSTPDSKYSITPSEGEEPDAFHVRSTYAQLDQRGVKGDGIVEGVERTRARVGANRASELRAAEALADEHEKTRELTSQEIQVLGSLDRYGFYVTPSHDRLILLSAAPLQKPLSIVTATSPNATANPPVLNTQPPPNPPIRETSRTAKWSRMLVPVSRDQGGNVDEWGIKPSKQPKLIERTFKGIPDCWRSGAWEVLMNRFSRTGKKELRQLGKIYRDALEKPSTYDVQIDLDVPRTITGHVMFKTRYGQGQRSLFHVLHSLSLHCPECGYCQGMGPIAATLLCYFDPERVYASLVRLHDHYAMHTIFSPGFPGLLEAIYVQERIIEQMMPPVYAAFKKHMISTTSYATKWYITLFANSVPFQTQLRLWDAFLLEGHDVFVVVAVAIVWVYRDYITSESANFESILSLLSSFFVPEDENALLSWIEKVMTDQKVRESMKRWRQDWNRLVSTEQHHTALL
ncbi:Rab GTPase-activating TBC domain-containing protein [Abortiporus biennis]